MQPSLCKTNIDLRKDSPFPDLFKKLKVRPRNMPVSVISLIEQVIFYTEVIVGTSVAASTAGTTGTTASTSTAYTTSSDSTVIMQVM